jgi:hypothetical protein
MEKNVVDAAFSAERETRHDETDDVEQLLVMMVGVAKNVLDSLD